METMEKEPLLGRKTSGHPSRNKLPYSRSSISDDTVENSVYSYCGDNYNIPIPDRRKTRSDTTSTSHEEPAARRFHRPLFICLATITQVGLLIYMCVAGRVETIAFKPRLENTSINSFGYIGLREGNDSVHKQNISRYCGVNWFIGPNSSFLVQTGAKFGPCMKKLKVLEDRITNISKKEANFVCCSYRGECGMMKNTSCPGNIIDSGNCTVASPYCTHGITLRPCCLGLHSQCEVTSEQYCLYEGGHWYKDEILCSKVNCLDGICGMSGVENKSGGSQGYRLITAIFLHLGVIHLLTNLGFQIPVGVLIEREIGSIRMALIYMISGIGGNLVCVIFDPNTPQAGASGALFGLLALLIVKLLQLRHEVKRPFVESLILLGVALISFALGTLPYIGNFVHIGGFVFGISASLAFLPRSKFSRCRSMALYASFKGVFLLVLSVLIIVFCVLFFLVKDSNFCWWCKYIDCVPYTKHFCPSMDADGYLDNGEAS